VRPGNVVYELDGVNETMAREAFALAAAKLPLKTTFVVRQLGQTRRDIARDKTVPTEKKKGAAK